VKQPDFNYNFWEMESLAFEEELKDRAPKNMYQKRIDRFQQMREDLRNVGAFENADSDFHPRNRALR
jgi:hypothetical protein